jgi:hypothetical protein
MSVAFNYREAAQDDFLPSTRDDEGSASRTLGDARFDVCPTWLELAARHLSDARAAQHTRVTGSDCGNETAIAGAFEWEFEASLQAIVAYGIAVDAFAAAVQSRIQLPQSLSDEWRRDNTPRYVQISEVLRRAFSLSAGNAAGVRQCVGEILRFHDLAIDPSQKRNARIFHPEHRAAVEWRFAYFRYENALLIAQSTMRLIWELVACAKSNDAEVQNYADALRVKVEPLQYSGALKVKTW